MKLEPIGFGAQLAVNEEPLYFIKCDAIDERVRLSDTVSLNVHGIIDLHSFAVKHIVKKGLFKDRYDIGLQQLNVIVMKREENHKEKWTFLCNSKELFLTIAKEFALAYTLVAIPDKYGIIDDMGEEVKPQLSPGKTLPSAKCLVDEMISARNRGDNLLYDAYCAFIKYLLEQGEINRKETASKAFYWNEDLKNYDWEYKIKGCEFQMPDDRENFHPITEMCLIYGVSDFGSLYNLISYFLPQNIGKRAALERGQLQVELGRNFEKKEEVLEKYRQFVATGDYVLEVQKTQQNIERWTKLIKDGIDEKDFGEEYLVFLRGKIKILENKICEELERCDFDPKYEEDHKVKMLVWLINFKQDKYGNAENKYQDFRTKEKLFQEILENSIASIGDLQISQYYMFYHFGRILIGDCLGKSKDNHKNISKKDLDFAMMYFYDTDTAQEAYKLKEYQKNRKKGIAGEEAVEHELDWLDPNGDYMRVPKKWSKKCLDNIIKLYNPDWPVTINEPQEYDHILIGRQGVFVIETKSYKGKSIVYENGKWKRDKKVKKDNGDTPNPLPQIDRHVDLLRSFLKEIPVKGVICIAHKDANIEGKDTYPVPLKYVHELNRFIKGYRSGGKELTKAEMEECMSLIESHRYQEEHVMSKWCFNYDTEKHEIIRCRRF